ncbi:ornithine cyclodeaminase family protein [Pseudomonas aeruginosa]|jgi:ornithine cyclodeaminase/alanine dehydrogenase-like protein (mu-crystallin family)|nr:ornithine cyclodeaminase family protein [Pseudomonas aeruginosa]MCS9139119.1 ornithine cyclodeaminase family protein [Pseudomonas aeruginosa]MCS9211900.1 ornithine cyclodeaminase family protein [Pseudomonas aeruginosa]
MTTTSLWLTEDVVSQLVPLEDAIEALERSLLEVADGVAFNVPKALGDLGQGSAMHCLGSASPKAGVCGFKTWVHTGQGAKALFSLFSAENGQLLAMMEANTLGQLRTAAMTAVGTRWLVADAHVNEMSVIGSGKQALGQIQAVNAVRPLSRIRIWSPNPERRSQFVEKVRANLKNAQVIDEPSIEAATEGAALVTVVTRATLPFFPARLLAPGAHLNAVGAILPGNAEIFPDVFERAKSIVVDDITNTRKASREFIDYFGADDEAWARVQPLSSVIQQRAAKTGAGDITLFKAMGMGLSDLAIARLVYERASVNSGIGVRIPTTSPAPIRLRAV